MRKLYWLFVLLLVACVPSPASATTTSTPFNLVLPTPLPDDRVVANGRSYPEPSTPSPLQTAVPTRQLANSWQTYRDPNHNIGLAYPAHWQHTISNTTFALQNCVVSQPPIALTFTSFSVEPSETTTSWLYNRLGNENRIVETVEEGFTGSYPSLLAVARGEDGGETAVFSEILIRFTPETLLLIQLNTLEVRYLPDVQAIFNSLAAPDQPITIPAAPPANSTARCQ